MWPFKKPAEEDAPDETEAIAEAAATRAPHNPHQQLITKTEAEQLPARELIARAGENVPALVTALETIAGRFEQSVQATHELNRGLARFRDDVVVPLREELKGLRFDLGDRVKASAGELSVYVEKLDKVIWAALRAAGMTDAQIRAFREENGMQPEAPRGHELEAHMREVAEMRETIETLTIQNRRLIARLGGHWFTPGESDWSLKDGCKCEVCRQARDRIRETGDAQHELHADPKADPQAGEDRHPPHRLDRAAAWDPPAAGEKEPGPQARRKGRAPRGPHPRGERRS